MKKPVVYLAGLISTDFPESLKWRTWVTPLLEAAEFCVLSPLRGKESLSEISRDGGLTHPDLTQKDIVIRDYQDILSADLILVNLYNFGSPRPLLGTIAELAWAWEHHIPVIAVCYEDDYVMRKHPFLSEFVSHYFSDLAYAAEFITIHYGRK
jgi:nucleoside 2-deoxyribosyltransferase